MNKCFFINGLYGNKKLARKAFSLIRKEKPDFVFIAGREMGEKPLSINKKSILGNNFISDFLFTELKNLRHTMECAFPDIMITLDPKTDSSLVESFRQGEKIELWMNIHQRCRILGRYRFYGCSGPYPSLTPEESLLQLAGNDDLEFGIFFVNFPQTIQPDKMHTNHDEINDIADNFIKEKLPYIVMETLPAGQEVTEKWKQQLNRTWHFVHASNPSILSIIEFNLHEPWLATRKILAL